MKKSRRYSPSLLGTEDRSMVLLAGLGAADSHQQQQYRQIKHDLDLYLTDPLMRQYSGEEFPYALLPSGSPPIADLETFFAGRTPFNVIWARAVQQQRTVEAYAEAGPYPGLSPIGSTVGQLFSWSRLLGSSSWKNRFDAEPERRRDERFTERGFKYEILLEKAEQRIHRADPVFAAAIGRSYPYQKLRTNLQKCKGPARHRPANCEEITRRWTLWNMMFNPAPRTFKAQRGLVLSLSDLRAIDPLAGSRVSSAIDLPIAVTRKYASPLAYAERLRRLIEALYQVDFIFSDARVASEAMNVLVLMHRERRRAFTHIVSGETGSDFGDLASWVRQLWTPKDQEVLEREIAKQSR